MRERRLIAEKILEILSSEGDVHVILELDADGARALAYDLNFCEASRHPQPAYSRFVAWGARGV